MFVALGLVFGALFRLLLSLERPSTLGTLLGGACVLGGFLGATIEVRNVWRRWAAPRRVTLEAVPYR